MSYHTCTALCPQPVHVNHTRVRPAARLMPRQCPAQPLEGTFVPQLGSQHRRGGPGPSLSARRTVRSTEAACAAGISPITVPMAARMACEPACLPAANMVSSTNTGDVRCPLLSAQYERGAPRTHLRRSRRPRKSAQNCSVTCWDSTSAACSHMEGRNI